MRFPALGEAATQLPWLSPCVSSLLALARKPAAAAWLEVCQDPGAVLLIVRQCARTLSSPALSFFPALLREPAILQGASRFLAGGSGQWAVGSEKEETAHERVLAAAPASSASLPAAHGPRPTGFVDWNQAAVQPIYQASLTYAWTARRLAELADRSDAQNAWVAGLLAPLGWLAVCAADPGQAAACLADPALPQDPVSTQQRHWGYDQAGIARRLLRRWRVPDWLAVTVGHLGLPREIAIAIGADPDLFHLVQLAVGLVQQRGLGLHLLVGAAPGENAAALGLSAQDLSESVREWESDSAERGARSAEDDSTPTNDGGSSALRVPRSALRAPAQWSSPYGIPFLHDLLCLAAENLRLRDSPTVEQLERDRDQLHQALEKQRHGQAERLQALKLNALAEFAAGAAHEINNPLAVISGQAQYLLGREAEPTRQRALQTINGQAHRIHQLLSELMQFARPPRLQKQVVDLPGLLREVTLSLTDLAAQRQVQLVCPDPDAALRVLADPRLIRTALECLLRNAIEAAPPGGWAGIRVDLPAADRLEFVVEDSGNGPAPSQRDHLFDPFYSGRLAGRGRGFGLPTAWRLAREHGGDVRFDRPADGPTRFILNLPCQSPGQDQPSGVHGAEMAHEPSNGCPIPLRSHPDLTKGGQTP